MLDPLAVFLRNTFDERGLTPIPLVSTDHDVVIAAGLAVVTTHRLFKNIEDQNIEAVLTFPLPVLATLFELTAEVDGRKLKAKAQETLPALRKVALPSDDVMISACYDRIEASERHSMSASSKRASGMLFERISYSSRRPMASPISMASPSNGLPMKARLARKASMPRMFDTMPSSENRPGVLRKMWAMLTGSERQSIVSLLNDEMKSLAHQIDWGRSPRDLICGDLSELSDEVAAYIRRLSEVEAVVRFAELNGLTAAVLVIGLLARSIAEEDRRANRVWKAISDLMTASVPEELSELELQIIDSL